MARPSPFAAQVKPLLTIEMRITSCRWTYFSSVLSTPWRAKLRLFPGPFHVPSETALKANETRDMMARKQLDERKYLIILDDEWMIRRRQEDKSKIDGGRCIENRTPSGKQTPNGAAFKVKAEALLSALFIMLLRGVDAKEATGPQHPLPYRRQHRPKITHCPPEGSNTAHPVMLQRHRLPALINKYWLLK